MRSASGRLLDFTTTAPAFLVVTQASGTNREGESIQIASGEKQVLGRDPKEADISFPEIRTLSSQHAQLEQHLVGLAIRDLESKNGTFINGVPVAGPTYLSDGDTIRLGELELRMLGQSRGRQNEALYRLVNEDGLTGADNRFRLQSSLASECVRARRHKGPFALVFFDLDGFKAVNDNHGHEAGDRVLREVVRLCERGVRGEQTFARWGGDEFCATCPGTAALGAAVFAEKLQRWIAEHEDWGVSAKITGSFGVAEWSSALDTPELLMQAADQAAIRAKRNGGNQVQVFGSPS